MSWRASSRVNPGIDRGPFSGDTPTCSHSATNTSADERLIVRRIPCSLSCANVMATFLVLLDDRELRPFGRDYTAGPFGQEKRRRGSDGGRRWRLGRLLAALLRRRRRRYGDQRVLRGRVRRVELPRRALALVSEERGHRREIRAVVYRPGRDRVPHLPRTERLLEPGCLAGRPNRHHVPRDGEPAALPQAPRHLQDARRYGRPVLRSALVLDDQHARDALLSQRRCRWLDLPGDGEALHLRHVPAGPPLDLERVAVTADHVLQRQVYVLAQHGLVRDAALGGIGLRDLERASGRRV